jgi:hypothetical protein
MSSKPYIDLITCESGDWQILRVNYGEDFEVGGHSLSSWDWIRLVNLLGFEVEEKVISDKDMENCNY